MWEKNEQNPISISFAKEVAFFAQSRPQSYLRDPEKDVNRGILKVLWRGKETLEKYLSLYERGWQFALAKLNFRSWKWKLWVTSRSWGGRVYSAPSFTGHRGKIYLRQQKLRKKQHADAQKLATKEAARQSYFLQNKTKKAVGNLASASSQVGRKGEEWSGILAASRNKTERGRLLESRNSGLRGRRISPPVVLLVKSSPEQASGEPRRRG